MPFVENNIIFENARIIFKNFEGRTSEYNRDGKRSFSVIIPDADTAQQLQNDGWNVKVREPRTPEDNVEYRLNVNVNFSYKPPKIVLVNGRDQMVLNEDNVKILDQADIAKVDLVISPYNWTRQGMEGVSAYLKTMYAVLEQDEFADKYKAEDAPF